MRGLLVALAVVAGALLVPATAQAAPPPNDMFASPELIGGASGTVQGTTAEATSEPGEPASLARQHSIWYSWTAPTYGRFNFNTLGTTYVWVFTGDSLESLVLKVNGQSYGYFSARAGETYRIALDDWSAGGPTTLSWTFEELPPPPPNDDWANAQPLEGTGDTVMLDTLGATRESCEPTLGNGNSVWYAFTAPADGALAIHAHADTRGTIAAVFTGGSVCSLSQRAYSAGESSYADVLAGQTYWIGVDTWAGGAGPTSFSWSFTIPPRPVNDDFADATPLGPEYRGTLAGTLRWATHEPGEYGGDDLRTVWYRWTPQESGLATIQVQLASAVVWRGAELASLQSIGIPSIQFEAAAGETYHVQVHTGTDFTIEWLLEPHRPPANDDFAIAQPLFGTEGVLEATNRLATVEPGEPLHGGVTTASRASVWFQWTAERDGTAAFRVDSSFWTIHAAYVGDSVSALAEVSGSRDVDAQRIEFPVQAGQTYRIAVDGRAGGTGIFWLAWSFTSSGGGDPPANDHFGNAEPLWGIDGGIGWSNALATAEPGEPLHAGVEDASGATVWFEWTAEAPGPATFRVLSEFPSVVAAYVGDSVDALVGVDATYDLEAQSLSFAAEAGQTYRIAVDGRGGDAGFFELHWLVEATGSPPVAKPDTFATNEDEPLTVSAADLLANDGDPDGDAITFTGAWTTAKSNGTVELDGDRIMFTPTRDFSGTGSFTYSVADATGLGASTTVRFRIEPVNDAPTVELVPGAAEFAEGGSVALVAKAADVDSTELTYRWRADGGTIIGDGPNATLTVDDGPALVRVEVAVFDGRAASAAQAEVAVENVAPSVEATGASGVWGLPVTVTGSATDPSEADNAAGLAPFWSIEDGTVAAFTASHVYNGPGSYTATLTVADKDGGTASGDVAVEIGRRGSTVALISPTTALFGFGTVEAKFGDAVDSATARVDRRIVQFAIGHLRLASRTIGGVATVNLGRANLAAPLLPGTHVVHARFGGDALYLPSGTSGLLTIVNSVGKTTGEALLGDGTALSLGVSSDGTAVKGALAIGSVTASLEAFGASGNAAWVAGTAADGRRVVAYVEDNGEPGRGADLVRIWIGGELHAGSGMIGEGNIRLHR